MAWLLVAAAPAHAQQAIGEARIYATERIVIGGSTFGTTSPAQIVGLPNLAGTVLTVDGSGNIGLAATGTATISAILSATGAVNLGDASGDDIAVNGRLTTALLWKTDNAVDIGASGANRARDFFLGRNAAIGGTLGVTGASTLAALSATTGSFSSTLGVTGAATLSSTLGVTGATTFGNNAGTSTFASRTTGWRVTTTGDADVRSLFVDNLSARTFTADLEQVIVGSQRVTKSSSTISQAFTCPALGGTSTLWVDDIPSAPNLRVFASGDSVSTRNFTRSDGDSDGNLDLSISDCVGVVTSYADGTSGNDGQQSWTFTRNTGANGGGMTASTVVAVKTLALDYGTTGMGFAEVSAVDGSEGQNAPYYQLATWTTAPIAANTSVKCRLGKLAGIWDYAAGGSIFGLACGDSAATNITIDPTNGFRIRYGTTNKVTVDTSGNASFNGAITAGSTITGSTVQTASNCGTSAGACAKFDTSGLKIYDASNVLLADVTPNGFQIKPTGAYANNQMYGFTTALAGGGYLSGMSYYETDGATDSKNLKVYAAHDSSSTSIPVTTTAILGSYTSQDTFSTQAQANVFATSHNETGTASDTAEAQMDASTPGGALAYFEIQASGTATTASALYADSFIHFNGSGTALYSSFAGVGIGTSSIPQRLTVNGGVQVNGAATLSASMSYGTFSIEYPSFREYIGDGTGYSRKWSKRASSTTTDLMTLTDAGLLTIVQTTTSGTAMYPFVSDSGTIKAKTDGKNGTVTCTAGSSVVIAVEYGLVKSITGSGCS